MKKNKLDAIGYIDDQLVEKADKYTGSKKKRSWIKWSAMAACLCLVLCGVLLTDMFGKTPIGNDNQDNSVIDTIFSTGKNEEPTNDVKQGAQESGLEEKEVIIVSADYPHYTSLSDLERKSDFIIYGIVLSESYEWMSLRIKDESDDENLNPGGEVDDDLTLVTVYEVNVIDCYKTSKDKPDVIKVLMIGGETEDAIYKTERRPEIKTADKYIFFLSESTIIENGGWLLNDTQSLYSIKGDKIICVSDDGFELSFEELNRMKK